MTLPGAPCFRGLTELTNFQLNAQTLAGLRLQQRLTHLRSHT